MKNKKALIILALVVTAAVLVLLATHTYKSVGKKDAAAQFLGADIVTSNNDIPLPILFAITSADGPWRHFSENWPDHFIRIRGYTCGVWKWPTATWDLERQQMSDEYRIWVKDDIAKVVPTPSFFLSSQNTKATPPRLSADKALAIAEMKTGIFTGVTNVVKDVGDFFKVDFFLTRIPQGETKAPRFSVWVAKTDWSVRGNPFSPVPPLTDEEALYAMTTSRRHLKYDDSLPVKIEHIADLTILSLPYRSILGNGAFTNTYYWASFWIDNATRTILYVLRQAD